MGRLTALSIANLKAADAAGIEPAAGGFMVWVARAGNRAYLHDSQGIQVYSDKLKARRNVLRVRPDLEPTEI